MIMAERKIFQSQSKWKNKLIWATVSAILSLVLSIIYYDCLIVKQIFYTICAFVYSILLYKIAVWIILLILVVLGLVLWLIKKYYQKEKGCGNNLMLY